MTDEELYARGSDHPLLTETMFDFMIDMTPRQVAMKENRTLEVMEGQGYTTWVTTVGLAGDRVLCRFNLLFGGERLVIDAFGKETDDSPTLRLMRGGDHEIILAGLL